MQRRQAEAVPRVAARPVGAEQRAARSRVPGERREAMRELHALKQKFKEHMKKQIFDSEGTRSSIIKEYEVLYVSIYGGLTQHKFVIARQETKPRDVD